jgi:hypothetical protein
MPDYFSNFAFTASTILVKRRGTEIKTDGLTKKASSFSFVITPLETLRKASIT